MEIIITSKNITGESAMKKMMEDSSYGIAKRSVINEEPYTIKIKPKGLNRFDMVFKNNPYAMASVEHPMKKVLLDYGATEKDFEIEIQVK